MALAEVALDGHVTVHRHGPLAGRLVLRPSAEWLRKSPLMSPLAVLLREVPVSVGGTLASPRFRADPREVADGAVARSPLGRRLRGILATLLPEAFGPPPRTIEPSRLLSTDALLDRLAADGADGAEHFEALLERGLSTDEIARAVARRR